MPEITAQAILDQLPVTKLEQSLTTFLAPLMAVLPDRRLQAIVPLCVRGIIGSDSPVVTQIAQQVAREESGVWASRARVPGSHRHRGQHTRTGHHLRPLVFLHRCRLHQ